MNILTNKLLAVLHDAKANGSLQVLYALLAEALFIGLLFFMSLFTLETLLPTFVTIRFSLTKFFLALVLLTLSVSLLGRFIGVSFSWNISRKSPLLFIGLFWALGILTVSLIKFPLPLIPLIIALLFLSGYLFSKILTAGE